MDYESLGSHVRRARKAAGMTQYELAERLGISTSFLGHIERGSRKASLETLVKISNELKVSLDDLMEDSLDNRPEAGAPACSPKQKVALREAVRTLMDNIDVFMDEQ